MCYESDFFLYLMAPIATQGCLASFISNQNIPLLHRILYRWFAIKAITIKFLLLFSPLCPFGYVTQGKCHIFAPQSGLFLYWQKYPLAIHNEKTQRRCQKCYSNIFKGCFQFFLLTKNIQHRQNFLVY